MSKQNSGKTTGTTPKVKVVRAYLVLLVFLLPLKFGTVLGISEIALLPTSIAEWLIGTWPPFVFPILSGSALLLVVLLLPPPRFDSKFAVFPAAWLLLPVLVLPGLIRTTEWDHALLFIWYLIGISCLVIAVYWTLPHDDGLIPALIGGIALGVVFSCISAWRQRFGGLQETYEFARQAAEEQGRQLPPAFLSRLQEKRVFGPFVYPNSLAAHLILTGPLLLLWLWRALRRIDPVPVSRAIFMPLAAVLLGGALWFSGSRAALVAIGGAMVLTVILHPAFQRYRKALIICCAAAALLVFLIASRGRTLSSLAARGDYYQAAVTMFTNHPFTGVGLGEFFPHYMQLKPPGAEETRLPHNLFLNLASQAGILGVLGAILCLILPLILFFITRRTSVRYDQHVLAAVLLGMLAWAAHSLADFNLHIPGSVAIFAILPFVVLTESAHSLKSKPCKPTSIAAVFLALFAVSAVWRLPGEYYYQRLFNYSQQRSISLRRLENLTKKTSQYIPLSPYPWVLLGRQAEHRQWHQAAVMAYEEAVKRSPHRASFHLHLAKNHLALRNYAEAQAAIARADYWYPTDPEVEKLQALLQ